MSWSTSGMSGEDDQTIWTRRRSERVEQINVRQNSYRASALAATSGRRRSPDSIAGEPDERRPTATRNGRDRLVDCIRTMPAADFLRCQADRSDFAELRESRRIVMSGSRRDVACDASDQPEPRLDEIEGLAQMPRRLRRRDVARSRRSRSNRRPANRLRSSASISARSVASRRILGYPRAARAADDLRPGRSRQRPRQAPRNHRDVDGGACARETSRRSVRRPQPTARKHRLPVSRSRDSSLMRASDSSRARISLGRSMIRRGRIVGFRCSSAIGTRCS